jgi:hypothetical protein
MLTSRFTYVCVSCDKRWTDAKDGVDAGDLVSHSPVGIRASRDVTSLLELEADCVIYVPEASKVAWGRSGKRRTAGVNALVREDDRIRTIRAR